MLSTILGVTGLAALALALQATEHHGSMQQKGKSERPQITAKPVPVPPAAGKSISQKGVKSTTAGKSISEKGLKRTTADRSISEKGVKATKPKP